MSEKVKILSTIGCGLGAFGAMINFVAYAATPQLKNIELIRNEATYVEQYNGANPSEAINQALERLDIVLADNPEYADKILEFKSELLQYQSALEPVHEEIVYGPDFDIVSGKLEDFANHNSKQPSNLVVGGLDLILAASLSALYAVASKMNYL